MYLICTVPLFTRENISGQMFTREIYLKRTTMCFLLYISTIILLLGVRLTKSEQFYQPVQSEIDRFKMIQEKIQREQQHAQNEELMDTSMAMARHPFLSHLISHLTGQPNPQQMKHTQRIPPQTSAIAIPVSPSALQHPSMLQEQTQMNSQIAVQQAHLPPPQHHLPALPQFPQVSLSPEQMAKLQEQSSNPLMATASDPISELVHGAHQINPDTVRMLANKNHMPTGDLLDGETNSKHHDNEVGHEAKTDSDRRDKHRHRDHSPVNGPKRCYACSWSIAQCADFNCYNNPDICTNNNFKPHRVHQADCPGGCEQYVVTDPNGLIQTWKRGCAPPSLPLLAQRCKMYYEFGIRIDRCICNQDWCNWAHSKHQISFWTVVVAFFFSLLFTGLF